MLVAQMKIQLMRMTRQAFCETEEESWESER